MAFITGQAVRGENFWGRPYLMEDIVEKIESGEHILLVAPRRVGKTSLMYHLMDTMSEEYIMVYVDTEAEHSVDDFWQKLFNELMDEAFIATLQNKASALWNRIKSIRPTEIGMKGVKFGDSAPIDYKKAFLSLLSSIDEGKKLVVLLDEFSQTVENIIQHESPQEAERLLQTHREIRQNHKAPSKVVFIYAGSIGLESVVSNIKATKHINDLAPIKVPPLEKEDAKAFVFDLCRRNDMELQESEVVYLLDKIEWLIPFYIQLVGQELKRLYRRNAAIDNAMIDKAIDKVLENRVAFVHWEERLNILPGRERRYAKDILSFISKEGHIKTAELHNMATKYQLKEAKSKSVIHTLEYDGYINNNDNVRIYRFNSPLLKIWWYRNVAN